MMYMSAPYGGLGFKRKRPRQTAAEREAAKERNRANARARGRRLAAERHAHGLNQKGEKYTSYTSWRIARGMAVKRHEQRVVDTLDRSYPSFASRYAGETSPLTAEVRREMRNAGTRERMRLHFARKFEYLREDILSGDVKITSYHQFVSIRNRALRKDAELSAALRQQYPEWYRKALAAKKKKRVRSS